VAADTSASEPTSESTGFGALVREKRLAAKLSQAALCERAGISTRALQDLERGVSQPHRDTLARLGSALGLSAEAQAELARMATPTPRRRASGPARLTTLAELNASGARHNLPHQLTTFVGRDTEVAELGLLLRHGRLVTLAGPGGIGKTRLALEVAMREVTEFAFGVWLVEIGRLVDSELLAAYVAEALGIRDQPARPLLDVMCEALRERSVLLVLDSCEHVLPACVALVDRILRTCPRVRVLVTSREPLGLTGEAIWRVAPLDEHGAARLFVERARAAVPRLSLDSRSCEAVARVCRRLDGVPLAIELAAAWTHMFSVEQIAERLDDGLRLLTRSSASAPPRQQTLRATIDWSYALLSESDRLLLDVLSVFAGGWSFEAAEAVVTHEFDEPEVVLNGLSRLVDKSLVLAEPAGDGSVRYRLLEVLRTYCAERLTSEVRQRHANYFLELAEQGPPRMQTAERKLWLDRLELELDNFRAARRWFLQRNNQECALGLSASLYFALVYRCFAAEGRASLEEALAVPGGTPETRARALHCLAALSVVQADYAAAERYGRESLALRRSFDDQIALAWSLFQLGCTAMFRADLAAACELFQEGREAASRGQSSYLIAMNQASIAYSFYLAGDYTAARNQAQHALQLLEGSGFAGPASIALVALGAASHQLGDLETARASLEAALTRAEALEEEYLIARAAGALSLVFTEQAETDRAIFLLRRGVLLARRLGNPHQVARMLEGLAAFAAVHAQLDAATRFVRVADAIRAVIGAPRAQAEILVLQTRLGQLDSNTGEHGWSTEQAVGAALTFLDQFESARGEGRQSLLRPG
jgi:non-specific serine/threonine protein kinase